MRCIGVGPTEIYCSLGLYSDLTMGNYEVVFTTIVCRTGLTESGEHSNLCLIFNWVFVIMLVTFLTLLAQKAHSTSDSVDDRRIEDCHSPRIAVGNVDHHQTICLLYAMYYNGAHVCKSWSSFRTHTVHIHVQHWFVVWLFSLCLAIVLHVNAALFAVGPTVATFRISSFIS